MAVTMQVLLDEFVYTQLQDGDLRNRWTRDELTQYVNLALRDLILRRSEAGVATVSDLALVEGVRQTLPEGVVRLRDIVRNIDP